MCDEIFNPFCLLFSAYHIKLLQIFYLSVLMIWKSFVAPKSVLQLMLISSFIIIFIVIDELG
jgi:hypothetical protein